MALYNITASWNDPISPGPDYSLNYSLQWRINSGADTQIDGITAKSHQLQIDASAGDTLEIRVKTALYGDWTSRTAVVLQGCGGDESYFLYTQAELSIWESRATSGPYRNYGDTGANTPGDWTRVQTRASEFLASPSSDRWDGGVTTAGCVPQQGSTGGSEPINPNKIDKIEYAAFLSLVNDDATYRNAVKSEILGYYIPLAKADFSNTSRWCRGVNAIGDINPGFEIASGINRLLNAYVYIRSSLSTAEIATIDAWFSSAGEYFMAMVDDDLDGIFSDRASGVFSDPSGKASPTPSSYSITKSHDGGWDIPNAAKWWNNRRAQMVAFYSDVGVVIGNQALTDSAKRFFQEWLKYAVAPDGTQLEWYRSSTSAHEQGWNYNMATLYHMVRVADVMARNGDSSLYTYSTSIGLGASAGGPKSLLQVLTSTCKYLDGTYQRYLQGHPGDEDYRLDGDETNRHFILEAVVLPIANIYYRDDYLKSIYLKTAPGSRPYPSSPQSAGAWQVWEGYGGTSPGVLFMHGQMENLVSPYT